MKKAFGVYLLFSFYIIVGLYLMFLVPLGLEHVSYINLGFLFFIYLIFGCQFFYIYKRHNIKIFEPFTLISIIYCVMFLIAPILDIIYQDTTLFGMESKYGTIKATVIFLIGYNSFILGYFTKKSIIFKLNKEEKKYIYANKNSVLVVNCLLWLLGFLSMLVSIINSGMSLRFVLTLGNSGLINQNAASESLGFLSMFTYLMVPSWMYISQYSKNKLLVITTYFLMFVTFLSRGFRFILIIIIIAPIILFFIKKEKEPSFLFVISTLLVLLFLIGIVQENRSAFNEGMSYNVNNFNIESITNALRANFSMYKTFYIMVERIPEFFPYSWGAKTFINPIIMIIPRIIWTDKFSFGWKSEAYLNEISRISGVAYPNIGEFYMDFGVIGVIIFMYLFGRICKWFIEAKDRPNSDIDDYIAYSIFVPTTLQLVIRGHMATNLYLVIFLFMPVIINKGFMNRYKRKSGVYE